MNGGECLACLEIGSCTVTSFEKIRTSYTCASFVPVSEAVWRARYETVKLCGEGPALLSLLHRAGTQLK
jgi:hypothetical protein